MSRIGSHLDAIETWLQGLQHEGAALVKECRRQLDLVDAEDVDRQSFQSPAGFLILPRYRLVPRADGGRDAEIWIVLAIACKARPGTSADVDVLDRSVTLAAALDDQDFGQLAVSAPAEIEMRPVLQSALETKGLAVAAVSFRQTLYRVVAPPAATQGLISVTGAGGPRPGEAQEFLSAEGLPTPEEQAIIDQWGGP